MRSETTTHDRVWRKAPRVPCPPRHPSVRPARSHSLPEERLLPGPLRHPSLPGVSLFQRFRCYLGRPPARHGPLRHPSLPGVSLFRCFRCYLDRPPALHGLLRYPSLPGVSRCRRIGSHLRRVTRHPARLYGTGTREQAASCDAFVLSRRPPAPGAPPSRTSPVCLIAKNLSNSLRTTAL